ncbi:hypothetical protein [Fredinandcohnia onubensis]|uniref:hypothetical protein n=1 Tax=Fredinandcohnia onubensis TaxID=1571209 RepID=UPI000C0BE67D|nr:hypothetical protein [Fredinandcohnia onubensis]
MIKRGIFILIFASILLASCNKQTTTPPSHSQSIDHTEGCLNGEVIEWVDVLMINDIKYEHHFPDASDEQSSIIEKGEKLGNVSFMMSELACSDHVMKNGDATYLPEETSIYEVKGYPSSFIVTAGDDVFVVDENKKAKTAGELYPLDGLVKNIHFESTEDGSRLHTFSTESKKQFIEAWYPLVLGDLNTLYKTGKFEGERVFIEIELTNGVSFRLLYWLDSNTFHRGAIGNDEIQTVIVSELEKLDKNK